VRQPLPAKHHWPDMEREDAIALLTMMHLDRDPPPPIQPERMAALLVELTSADVPDELRLLFRRDRR
jgi:hypothetical protein